MKTFLSELTTLKESLNKIVAEQEISDVFVRSLLTMFKSAMNLDKEFGSYFKQKGQSASIIKKTHQILNKYEDLFLKLDTEAFEDEEVLNEIMDELESIYNGKSVKISYHLPKDLSWSLGRAYTETRVTENINVKETIKSYNEIINDEETYKLLEEINNELSSLEKILNTKAYKEASPIHLIRHFQKVINTKDESKSFLVKNLTDNKKNLEKLTKIINTSLPILEKLQDKNGNIQKSIEFFEKHIKQAMKDMKNVTTDVKQKLTFILNKHGDKLNLEQKNLLHNILRKQVDIINYKILKNEEFDNLQLIALKFIKESL